MKPLILRNNRFGIIHFGCRRKLEHFGDQLTNESLIFSWYIISDCPKISNYDITFDLSQHSKSCLSATTTLISSTKVTIETFLFLKNTSGNIYLFRSLRLTSDRQNCQEAFFNLELFRFSNPGFAMTTTLMSSIKVSA